MQIRLNQIELIVYDFDGVMTDNRVIVDEHGYESVVVNRSDGLAVCFFKQIGIQQIILTTEKNNVVVKRADKLKIPVIQGVINKKEALTTYCVENAICLKNVIYVGNDINDLEAMKCIGYPVCPADAYQEIKEIAFVLDTNGGYGVIRELMNYIKK